jgi:hypothetical protein
MKKQKTTADLLIQGIKSMHPMYQGYLMDRIKKDAEFIKEELPAIWEKDRKDAAEGRVSLFHPNFYVQYVNMISDIVDSIDRLYHEQYSTEPFKPTEKYPYFEDETK